MKYSDHFSSQVKNFGVPQLNEEQFNRLMNIVFMEGLLSGLSENGKYDIKNMSRRHRGLKSLNELTNRKHPSVLFDNMKKLSKK